jgi:hypothetical protein
MVNPPPLRPVNASFSPSLYDNESGLESRHRSIPGRFITSLTRLFNVNWFPASIKVK